MLPVMRLFRTPGGCADLGGMYRCRFMGLMNVHVLILPFGRRLTVRSRKLIVRPGVSTSHWRSPKLSRFVRYVGRVASVMGGGSLAVSMMMPASSMRRP